MNDVRDEALGTLLDQEATRIESAPVDRLPEVLRRGSRLRAVRFTAIGTAVAVFVGAVSWAGLQNEGREAIPADIADWNTFASLEENGWTIQVPPSWRAQELPACPNAPERIGVMVTNVDFEFRDPRGGPPDCEDRLLFAGFPRDGVAFEFMPVGSRFGVFRRQPFDTVLPLTRRLLHQTDGIRGGPAESFLGIWVRRMGLAYVRRFESPDASSGDVRALDRVLGSLQVRGASSWVDAEVETRNEVRDLQVALTHPSGWEVSTYPRFGVMDAPNPIASVASPSVGRGSCREPLAPFTPVGRFGDPSVFVLISDATDSWTSPDLPGRPDVLRFQDAIEDVKGRCGPDMRALRFGFEEAGRQIHVDLMASGSMYRQQPEMLLYILNSIRIESA